MKRPKFPVVSVLVITVVLAAGIAVVALPSSRVAAGEISGVVRSQAGPEEGVWIIAETDDLPTKFRKIVVTGNGGQFVLPELPAANYKVWVRGYGLIDSEEVDARPGQTLDLTATVAATPQEAAQIYPASYWYSLIEPPATGEFPGSGPEGNGISADLELQQEWLDIQKQGCMLCHQLGNDATRNLARSNEFESTFDAYDMGVRRSQRGPQMTGVMSRFGRDRGLQMFADWSDRIAAGEVPAAPPRPTGLERNVVITMWDWTNERDYSHDHISTDKRDPTINPNGLIYGVNISNDSLSILDPINHIARSVKIPTRDDPATISPMIPPAVIEPSRAFGSEFIWTDPANPHNPMMDHTGRVWLTSTIRGSETPTWCREGAGNPYADYFPRQTSGRGAAYYDPATGEFELIDMCTSTHHLQFGEDTEHTLWFSGGGEVVGWLNTSLYDETGDARRSQGWCPLVLDTNGDGVITKPWNEPVGGGRAQAEGGGGGETGAFDAALDTRVNIGSYGVIPDPTDERALWLASTRYPGKIGRLHIGENPPESCIAEVYEVPSLLDPRVPQEETGFGPRGIDIDRNGIVWTALSGSSHLASFDRRKLSVLNGPEVVDGRHCIECWSLHRAPGPTIRNTEPAAGADHHYYNWVDQWNTLGLGQNVPIATGSNSDALLALLPETDEWVVMRVPYPMGFFSRGMDGRIDDPEAGWKGRAVYGSYGIAANWHIEGGKGMKPGVAKFQIRPDPLAR